MTSFPEPRLAVRSLAAATCLSVLTLVGVALALMFAIALLERVGIVGANQRYQTSMWAVLWAIVAAIVVFCYRSDSAEQSVLFGRWVVAFKWYAYAILAAVAVRFIGLPIWTMRGGPQVRGPVDALFAQAGHSIASACLAFAFFCVVVPVVEEIIFRRGVFALLGRFRPWVPVTASVVLFTVVHPTAGQGEAFLLALATAFLYLRSGSLLPSIACHGFANGVGVVLTMQGIG